jgi:hypothetical protein
MEDKLKNFIAGSRDEFDVFELRPDLWQDISKELKAHPEADKAKVIAFRIPEMMRYAAAIALIFVSAFLLGRYLKDKNDTAIASAGTVESRQTLERVAPELVQVEAHYASLIEQKKQELNEFDMQALGVDSDLDKEMKVLDSTYTQLKKDLLTNPNKEMVIDAMTVNMQLRIDLLNQQLNTLKKIKQLQSSYKDENLTI